VINRGNKDYIIYIRTKYALPIINCFKEKEYSSRNALYKAYAISRFTFLIFSIKLEAQNTFE